MLHIAFEIVRTHFLTQNCMYARYVFDFTSAIHSLKSTNCILLAWEWSIKLYVPDSQFLICVTFAQTIKEQYQNSSINALTPKKNKKPFGSAAKTNICCDLTASYSYIQERKETPTHLICDFVWCDSPQTQIMNSVNFMPCTVKIWNISGLILDELIFFAHTDKRHKDQLPSA